MHRKKNSPRKKILKWAKVVNIFGRKWPKIYLRMTCTIFGVILRPVLFWTIWTVPFLVRRLRLRHSYKKLAFFSSYSLILFFYKIVVFLTLHQTRVRWVKRLENEFSGKWRALIGRFEKVRTWAWFGLAIQRWCHFFFFFSSNNDETLKREKLYLNLKFFKSLFILLPLG